MNTNKRIIWKVVFALAFVYLLIFSATTVVSAQTLSLSLWPPLLEVMMQPGKSITQVYKLSNSGETDLAFTSRVVPFEPADELGNITFTSEVEGPLHPRGGVAPAAHPGGEWLDWFSFQNANLDLGQKFLLKPGETQEVVLKIKVPGNAAEDDYYATLLFETIPGVFLGQSGGQIEAKIGGNILLTVSQSGKPPRKVEILEFKIKNSKLKIIDSFTNPQFLVRLKNTGQALFKPIGNITTAGWFEQKWVLDLLPENVLINSVRQINCQKDDLSSPCRLPAKFLLGKYTGKLEFGLDEASSEYSKEIVFWAIPAKLTLGILTAIILLVIIKSKFKLPLDK